MSGIGRLDHACQTGRHSHTERGLDLYETPESAGRGAAARRDIAAKDLGARAAGRGAIVRILRARGHTVIASDVADYGFPLDFASDFLTTTLPPKGCGAIVTNPPYQFAEQFVAHALGLCPRVIMLLRLAFLESERRTHILERCGLRAVHVFRKRLPMMHRDGWSGPRASSAIPFAWFCWNREHGGAATIDRIGEMAP